MLTVLLLAMALSMDAFAAALSQGAAARPVATAAVALRIGAARVGTGDHAPDRLGAGFGVRKRDPRR
jgi:hypothetical protein